MQVPKRKKETYRKPKPDPYITEEKYLELKRRLKHMKEVKRPSLSREVQRLAAMGDFSENAGYQLAKGRLRGLNNRILDIEEQLKQAEIIPKRSDNNQINVGNLVTVSVNGLTKTYRLLGSSETDPSSGVISHNSPLGQALMGRQVGDKVSVFIKEREIEYEILKIE